MKRILVSYLERGAALSVGGGLRLDIAEMVGLTAVISHRLPEYPQAVWSRYNTLAIDVESGSSHILCLNLFMRRFCIWRKLLVSLRDGRPRHMGVVLTFVSITEQEHGDIACP